MKIIKLVKESYEEVLDWLSLLIAVPWKFEGGLYTKSSLSRGGVDLQQVSKVLIAKEDLKGKMFKHKVKHLYGENEVTVKNNFNGTEIEKFNEWREIIREQLKRINHKNNLPCKKEPRLEDLSKAELIQRCKEMDFMLRQSLSN